MGAIRKLQVGEKVFCRQGDDASVLATTHTYTLVEMRRNERQHVEVRVKNSLGEMMPGWFPIWPHFEPHDVAAQVAPVEMKSLGQVGFDAYGDAGAKPWKTFDGRDMPRWEALTGDTGALTRARWEASAAAITEEYMRRQGFEWDAFAHRWFRKGATGPAINWNRTTGA